MSRISVVVPTYNGRDLLPKCLDSLLRQTRAPDEIIVVDDASSDDSVTLLRRDYPMVRVTGLPVNGGFCRAVNAGIRASSGDYVALLNNDAEAEPEWLAELVRVLDADPQLGSCASKMVFKDKPDRINSAGIALRVDGVARDIGYGQADGPYFDEARDVFGACGGAGAFRRSALDEVGLFDEDYWAYLEDADWAFRAQLLGYSCRYVPEAVVHHRAHASFGRESYRAVLYGSRNALYLVLDNTPGRLLVRYGARIAAAQLYQLVYFATRGRARAVIRGKALALANLSSILRKRREILRRRRVSDEALERHLARGLEHSLNFPRAASILKGRQR